MATKVVLRNAPDKVLIPKKASTDTLPKRLCSSASRLIELQAEWDVLEGQRDHAYQEYKGNYLDPVKGNEKERDALAEMLATNLAHAGEPEFRTFNDYMVMAEQEHIMVPPSDAAKLEALTKIVHNVCSPTQGHQIKQELLKWLRDNTEVKDKKVLKIFPA